MTASKLPPVARHSDPDVVGDRRAVLQEFVKGALGPYADQATGPVEALVDILGVGRSSAYRLVREGRVPSIQVGKARRVLMPALAALLLGIERDEGAEPKPTPIVSRSTTPRQREGDRGGG